MAVTALRLTRVSGCLELAPTTSPPKSSSSSATATSGTHASAAIASFTGLPQRTSATRVASTSCDLGAVYSTMTS